MQERGITTVLLPGTGNEKIGNFAASMHLYINLFAYRAYLEKNARFVVGYITKYLPKVKVSMPESTYLMWMDFSGCRFTQEVLFLKMRDVKYTM